ncbi:MAG: response regulator [Ignavibacteria bacterium]|nr:response regulator [Ignavibacteria bacterium]
MEKNITVLYVDDEPVNLEIFEFYMRRRFNLFLAESGARGLEILEREKDISIVLSDMKMPGMNGLEFITAASHKRPELPFFILTGYDITPQIAQAIQAGLVKRYYSKPYQMKEIEAGIREAVA